MMLLETPITPVEEIELNTASAKGAVAKTPILIMADMPWVKDVLNLDDIGAEIVDLNAEGIQPPTDWEKKAIKVTLKPNEVKYLRINVIGIKNVQQIHIRSYVTGTAYLVHLSGWTSTQATNALPNTWVVTYSRVDCWSPPVIELNGGSEGGTIYITFIALPLDDGSLAYHSYPNLKLDGTTTYTYEVALPVRKSIYGVARAFCYIAGDGTNPINVNVYVKFIDGTYKQIASFSRTASSIALYQIKFPYKLYTEPQNDIQFILVRFEISDYGTFQNFGFVRWEYNDICYELNGLKTASASNTNTTVSSYTLIDTNGRANRYKQASVSLSSPSGGTAKLYINGKLVADYSGSSGTFNIPDDVDIWEITVELAGNGTTSATANFSGIEILGGYLVRR